MAYRSIFVNNLNELKSTKGNDAGNVIAFVIHYKENMRDVTLVPYLWENTSAEPADDFNFVACHVGGGRWRRISLLQGAQGIQGIPGTRGSDGLPGSLVYNVSGAINTAKIWVGTATTNSSGVFTADYTIAGFTTPPVVQATCVGPGSAASNARYPTLSSPPTAVSASGIVTTPTSAVLGLIPLTLAGAGVIVHITAIGK